MLFCRPDRLHRHHREARSRGDAPDHGARLPAGRRASWRATTGASRSSSATRSWPCSACPTRTRTTRARGARRAGTAPGGGPTRPEIEARTGVAIALHSGVNTGIVVTGELKFDHGTAGPLGDTINTAARLMNAAPSGELWVGPETRRLVARTSTSRSWARTTSRARRSRSPWHACAAARQRAAAPAHAFRGAFVGRQAELGALLGAAEKMRDGQPQVLGVCGDAGTGKTRLVNEFRAKRRRRRAVAGRPRLPLCAGHPVRAADRPAQPHAGASRRPTARRSARQARSRREPLLGSRR